MADNADIAWVIGATELVMLMTLALGFLYGSLVRKKNLVSTIVQCMIIFAIVSVIVNRSRMAICLRRHDRSLSLRRVD